VVSDTGPGISAEHLPHVCERFYRVDPARGQDMDGSGLGLAICRSIADAHGGQLRIESEFGAGTRATATIPIKAEGAASAYRSVSPVGGNNAVTSSP
jgi:two-component system phosphate regulon sensor histidine kinase PhoR